MSGAPSPTAPMSPAESILDFLDRIGVHPEIHSHPPVMTVAESLEYVSAIPGCKTKHLFLRDKRRRRHFLVVLPYDAMVELRALGQLLGATGLGFGSAGELAACLRVQPGAVSILAIARDTVNGVELVVDRAVWDADAVHAHPLDNSSTAVLTHAMLERFVRATGHIPTLLPVPRRAAVGDGPTT